MSVIHRGGVWEVGRDVGGVGKLNDFLHVEVLGDGRVADYRHQAQPISVLVERFR